MRRFTIIAAIVTLASAAQASTTVSYGYDALGRVKSVETRGTGGTGSLNAYGYDPASNRQNAQSSGKFKGALLYAPAQLNRGETMLSNDARFRLVMQFDGDLVLYDQNDTTLWHIGTNSGSFAAMQTDGNFVVYNSSGQAVLNSQTAGTGGSFLAVQPDGNVVVYTSQNQAVWSTGTYGH